MEEYPCFPDDFIQIYQHLIIYQNFSGNKNFLQTYQQEGGMFHQIDEP